MSKIIKNTAFLYLRMTIVLVVSLYTSRVILHGLGVVDYGLYNVIAGLVVSFSFITTTMTATSMRYYSISIGRNDQDGLDKLFNANVRIYVCFAIIFLIITEVIGLYFVYNVLNIPKERFSASVFLFHFSVLSCVLQILQSPFSSAIIAYEKMSFYGYIGILEAILKLTVAWLICISSFDKLVVYGFLLLLMYFSLLIIYSLYCRKNISACKFQRGSDKNIIKKIVSFSGWSLFESITDILAIQGISVLLNVFIGVVVNAAAGIASQVSSVVWGFISNFQTAFKPQLIKYFSQNEYDSYKKLLFQSSKFSYYLYFIIALPIILNVPCLFKIWLGDVPEFSVGISRIILINMLVGTLSTPIWVLVQAQGNIKKFQATVTSILLLSFPFAYVCLKIGLSPLWVFAGRGIVACLAHISRLLFMKKELNISIRLYFKEVLVPIIICSFLSSFLPVVVSLFIDGIIKLVITSVLSVSMCMIVFYYVGMKGSERNLVNTIINKVIKK